MYQQFSSAACNIARVGTGVVVLIGLLLAGCGAGGSNPFAKNVGIHPVSQIGSWPKVAVEAFGGLPPGRDREFFDALAASLERREIALVGTIGPDVYTLRGTLRAERDGDALKMVWTWKVIEVGAETQQSIDGQETVSLDLDGTVEPWDAVDRLTLIRVAAYMAEGITEYFRRRGYDTQIGGLPPPGQIFVRAGPDADKDINLSMLGPLERAYRYGAEEAAATQANGDVDDGSETRSALDTEEVERQARTIAEHERDRALRSPQSAPGKTDQQPAGTEIRAVAILPVTGAGEPADSELTEALHNVLKDAGWPVLDAPRNDALTIEGKVAFGRRSGSDQIVALVWRLRRPDGRELGMIEQGNKIPVAAISGRWGEHALYAAEAAASGIFDLVDQIR